ILNMEKEDKLRIFPLFFISIIFALQLWGNVLLLAGFIYLCADFITFWISEYNENPEKFGLYKEILIFFRIFHWGYSYFIEMSRDSGLIFAIGVMIYFVTLLSSGILISFKGINFLTLSFTTINTFSGLILFTTLNVYLKVINASKTLKKS